MCNDLELTRVADNFDTSHLHDSLLETVHTRIHIWLRFTCWHLFSISSQPVVVCQRLTFEFKVNIEKQQLDISHKCYVSETTVKPLLWSGAHKDKKVFTCPTCQVLLRSWTFRFFPMILWYELKEPSCSWQQLLFLLLGTKIHPLYMIGENIKCCWDCIQGKVTLFTWHISCRRYIQSSRFKAEGYGVSLCNVFNADLWHNVLHWFPIQPMKKFF